MPRDPNNPFSGKQWKRRQLLLRWHYRLGLIAVPLVVLLAVTGILLNHNATLKLHKAPIDSPGLRQWYGISEANGNMAEVVTWDRVLLDLHTGRFFGEAGIYVMDAAAILLLLLALSGIYNWIKRVREW